MSGKRRVGILISGTGSNMVALVEAMQSPGFPAEPAVVISNEPAAAGLARAAERGVATAVVDHRAYRGDRDAFGAALDRALRDHGVDLLAHAGFMRIHAASFAEKWQGRALNIHPSLLPLFTGLDTHARALAAGVAVHGCTVHEVTAELDAGPILGQAVVPVRGGDTAQTLAARVLRMEHRLYPAVLRTFAEDPASARRNPVAMFGGDD